MLKNPKFKRLFLSKSWLYSGLFDPKQWGIEDQSFGRAKSENWGRDNPEKHRSQSRKLRRSSGNVEMFGWEIFGGGIPNFGTEIPAIHSLQRNGFNGRDKTKGKDEERGEEHCTEGAGGAGQEQNVEVHVCGQGTARHCQ